MYAVIMAGGQGTRLWPISRKKLPKQLQKLTSEKTLIQETYDRLTPQIDPHNILVSTTSEYLDAIKMQLPEIPESNYIIEPFANGTAAACGLATAILFERDPKATVAIIYSDHSIGDNETFRAVLKQSEKLVEKHPDHIITVGIKPSRPDTGLGYIQTGKEIDGAFKVERFVEKPDLPHAEEYVKSGRYLWNTGMFVWRVDHFMDLLKEYMPETDKVLSNIAKKFGHSDHDKYLIENYGQTENTSVDYGIMEKTKDILVIPGDFGWSDIGNWSTLFEALSKLEGVNVVSRGQHISCGDTDCLVMAESKLIATVGLKDIVVIDTPDALLICNRHEAHRVKDVLAKIKEQGKEEYL